MVTAAGFQLKGSGWYATDFKGGAEAGREGGGRRSKPEAKSAGDEGRAPRPACGTGACPACQ